MQASEELTNPFPTYERRHASRISNAGASTSQVLTSSYKIADVGIGVASVLGAFIATNLAAMPGHAAGFLVLRISVKNLLLLAFFAVVWSGIFRAFGLYQKQNCKLNLDTVLRLTSASAGGSLFAFLFVVTSRAGAFGRNTVLVSWLLSVALAIAVRVVLNGLTDRQP